MDDSEYQGDDESTIGEELPIEQQLIPFMGDDLAAALTDNGSIFITLPGMCAALGLNVKGQMQRIKRTNTLAKGLRIIPIKTRGGNQRINCLRIDKIGLWLAGVQTGSIKSEFRAKIEAYQEELAPIATQLFLRIAGIATTQIVPSTDPQLAALAEQIDTLTDITTFLREHMESLLGAVGQIAGSSLRLDQAVQLLESLSEQKSNLSERQAEIEHTVVQIDARTKRLTPAHQREAQVFVERMVRTTKHAYSPLTYSIIYGRLKHRFKVGSYSEIADERFDEVMNFLRTELRKATDGKEPEQGNLF